MTWTASPSIVRFEKPISPAPHLGVRLTRRGRVVVLLAFLGVVLMAFTLGRAATSQAATGTPTSLPSAQSTVHEGESLWSIARRIAPNHDPRAVVQEIRELNHLHSAAVRIGQQLLLPRR